MSWTTAGKGSSLSPPALESGAGGIRVRKKIKRRKI
jgi:hypothetical protein